MKSKKPNQNEETIEDVEKESQKAEEEVTTENSEEGAETEASSKELDVKEQLSEMEDKFLRAQAEIANMRNRFQKERESLAKYRSQDLGKALLPAIDNLERAMAIEVSDTQGTSLKKGIEMVLESLQHALKEEGFEEIPAAGQVFDPNLHQAVQTVPATDGQKPDQVIQVLQKGYKLHDRVLRPTMVIVTQ